MSDEITSDEQDNRGTSRRTLLKGAAVGAGALWAMPVIDSFVSPAAASSTTAFTVPGTVQHVNIGGLGGVAVALPASGTFYLLLAVAASNTLSLTAGNSWTSVTIGAGTASGLPSLYAWYGTSSSSTAPTLHTGFAGAAWTGVILGFNGATVASAGTATPGVASPISGAVLTATIGRFVLFGGVASNKIITPPSGFADGSSSAFAPDLYAAVSSALMTSTVSATTAAFSGGGSDSNRGVMISVR